MGLLKPKHFLKTQHFIITSPSFFFNWSFRKPGSNIFMKSFTILFLSLLLTSSFILLKPPWRTSQCRRVRDPEPVIDPIDLRRARFPLNRVDFGPTDLRLRLAVFSKMWPVGPAPGGMERHAFTLYNALAARGHVIHVFTVPSDRREHSDIHNGNLHVYFVANEHGTLDLGLAFEIFNRVRKEKEFDYVHTESVALPHWRVKMVGSGVAVTWHGIQYESMHSKLFQALAFHSAAEQLQVEMLKLLGEIAFFKKYTQHICISNSAAEILRDVYQIPDENVHVILNGVDEMVFRPDPEAGTRFREKHKVAQNASVVMGVAGRLVQDKGHPLLHEAFSRVARRYPGVILLVAGSGPWEKRYTELGPSVKVLGPMLPSELSGFYNAIDVFVNPTLRPQGLDLTLVEAMHCGKPVVAPNYPSITGTVLVKEAFGYMFSPNVGSLTAALERAVKDGPKRLQRRGLMCREYSASLFTATKMASSYERFFLCMKDERYCKYPLATDP